jgi:hypothetical protein
MDQFIQQDPFGSDQQATARPERARKQAEARPERARKRLESRVSACSFLALLNSSLALSLRLLPQLRTRKSLTSSDLPPSAFLLSVFD